MDKIFSSVKQRIFLYLDNQGIAKEDFYKNTGISASNFKGLGAKSALGSDKIEHILSIYKNLSPQWLIMGEGSMLRSLNYDQSAHIVTTSESDPPKYGRIPLLPVSAAAGRTNGDVTVNEFDIIDNYTIPEFSNKGVKYLIRASGSSMYPKYSNGDLLACRPITDHSFFQWGKVYVLDTDQGPLVKRLYECKADPDCVECHSDNKEHYPPFTIRKSSIRKISIVMGVIRLE